MAKENRILGLDILRAIAILCVVIIRSSNFMPESFIRIIQYIAFDGVSIFFVLSGFLIGGTKDKYFHATDSANIDLIFWYYNSYIMNTRILVFAFVFAFYFFIISLTTIFIGYIYG